MGKHERIVSDTPPASRVPAVIDHLRDSKLLLGALEMRIPKALLASIEKHPGADRDLAELRERVAAVRFAIEHHAKARDLAAHFDAEALVAWKAAVQQLPVEQIIDGITKDTCCRRCIPGTGCAITGSDPLAGPCAHPVLVGPLELNSYRADAKISALYAAACAKLGIIR